MAHELTFDPAFQKAFTEAIKSENRIRMKWYSQHAAKTAQILDDVVEEQYPEVTKYLDERSQQSRLIWPTVNGTSTIIRAMDPPKVMKEVPRKDRNYLYEGISREDKGRAKYLKQRKKLDQDQKYLSPICSNWDYGWQHQTQQQEVDCDDPEHCQIQEKCIELSQYRYRR